MFLQEQIYQCKNKNCQETWDVDFEGNLVPSYCQSGSWKHISDSTNCPACDDYEIDWVWIRNREVGGW